MSEKEEKIAKTFKKVLTNLPEEKKEYLLGVADGMAVMAERQKVDRGSGDNLDAS